MPGCKGRLPEKAIRAIYREIMSASLALEKDLTIAYFGPEATKTHQAARNKFGASVRYVPQVSIGDVFDVVARGNADYGVVPIENSTEGAVNHTLDMFMESELRICAQILIEDRESSRGENSAGEDPTRIYSHPQVFGQCRQWLRHNLPHVELVEVSSTRAGGGTGRRGRRRGRDRRPDGRGSARAARFLEAVDAGHREQHHALSRHRPRDCPPTGDDRTSLMVGRRARPARSSMRWSPSAGTAST